MSRIAIRGIGRAALSIAISTALVKALGMGKEVLVARNLGVSTEVDAFVVAFGVLSLFINVLLGMAPAALIPAYVGLRAEGAHDRAARLGGWATFGALLGSLLLGALLHATAPAILRVAGPGLAPEAREWAVALFRAMLPLLATGALTAFLGAILNAEERFFLPALVPALSALAAMGCLLLRPQFGIWAVVYGSLGGGVVEAGLLLAVLVRGGRLSLGRPDWTPLRAFLAQYAPMVSGGLLMSSTLLVDFGVASHLPPGSVASLNYANKIPMALVSFTSGALGTAALPYFSRMVAERDWAGLRKVLRIFLIGTFVVAGIGTGLLVLLSRPMVVLAYQRGSFGPEQAGLVTGIQAMYFLQLPFYLAGILLVRLISALGRNQILLVGTVLSAGLNLGLDLLLLKWMGLRGIALSTSLVYVASFLFMLAWTRYLLRHAEARP